MDIIILLSSVFYVISSLKVFYGERSSVEYSGLMLFAVSVLAVTELIISLRGIRTTRENREPILEAIKQTCLVSSIIAFVLVQSVILSRRGQEQSIYLDSVSIALGVISVFISLRMIASVYRKFHKKKK